MTENLGPQATEYSTLMDQYHSIDAKIDELLDAHNGHSDNMTDDERGHYRTLAQQRDELLNAMWVLELELFADDED